jgi:hypothetical protein
MLAYLAVTLATWATSINHGCGWRRHCQRPAGSGMPKR